MSSALRGWDEALLGPDLNKHYIQQKTRAFGSGEPSEVPLSWASDAERELRKVPFFVRGKARRNTERFATERGLHTITVETLYDAKAHFGR